MDANPQVSVVVCHHRARLIDACLNSIFASTDVELDVIVVTSDPTYTEPRVRLFFLDSGPASKRNLGTLHAQSAFIAYIDDDATISPDCLWHLWRWFQTHPVCGATFAKIHLMDFPHIFDDAGSYMTNLGFLWSRAGNNQVDIGQFDTPVRCLSSKSATCMVRKQAFEEVEGFDTTYGFLAEESDLTYRMWWQGWETWYVPMATSLHAFNSPRKPVAEWYSLAKIHRYGCRNYLRFLTTNLPTEKLWILPIHLSIWLLILFGFLVKGDWRRSWKVAQGIGDWLSELPSRWARRPLVQEGSRHWFTHHIWASPLPSYYLTRFRTYLVRGLHG